MRRIGFIVTLLWGCQGPDDIVGRFPSNSPAPSNPNSPEATPEDFCASTGPVLDSEACSTIANAFTHTFCACTDLTVAALQMLGTSSTLGFNGRMQNTQPLQTEGSVFGGSMSFSASATIAGDLHLTEALDSTQPIFVQKDARIRTRVNAPALVVGGVLNTEDVAPIYASASQVEMTTVSAEPACSCQNSFSIVDWISDYTQQNDNARLGVHTRQLSQTGATDLSLGCGRVFLNELSGTGPINIHVQGRLAIFVAGDVVVDQGLGFQIDDNASLDLFIGGSIRASTPVDFRGNGDVRVYIAGQSLPLSGGGSWRGLLYAPQAEVVTSSPLNIDGAWFIRRLSSAASITVSSSQAPFLCPL